MSPSRKPSYLGIFVATAGLLTTAGSALAQTTENSKTTSKSQKKKTVEELLQQADRGGRLRVEEKARLALPTVEKGALAPKKMQAEDFNQVKPPRTQSFLETGKDDRAKLEKYTDEQIAELYKLVKRFSASARRGDLWIRLAELYVEKAEIVDFRVQSKYDEELKAFHEGKVKAKPQTNNSEAREYNKKAIQLYEWFLRDFPKDPRIDQALFFLGYNYFELGNIPQGLNYYSRLTKEYPQSSFVIESHFALAEFYFENEKWKEAVGHYYEVAKRPKHRLANFSMYKLAWCEFRSGDITTAITTLEKLIQRNRAAESQTAEGKKVSKQRLEKEALRDLVLFYADDRKSKDSIEYFERIAGSESAFYLEKLAYLYIDRGQKDAAKVIFTYLSDKNPLAPKAFEYKYQLAQAYANAPLTKEYRQQLYSWVHDFGSSSPWYKANSGNKTLMESSNKLRETTLKTWILVQHQTAQNSRARFSQELANEGYIVYFQEFTNPPSAALADMHFFYGELLYDMERFEDAGAQYRWVVDNAPQSKYGSKATENIVLSLERSLPSDAEISKLVGNSVDPVPLAPKTEGFVRAAKYYIEKYPTAPKVAELKFRVGRLYYQHNQFDAAIPVFKAVVKDHPKTKYAEYSANLLLDSYNLKKDYDGLEKTGQELLTVSSISQSSAGSDIRGVIEKAQFKKAQDYEVAKDYKRSADQYAAFAKQNPNSSLATIAAFNAAINYERAGENDKAIQEHQMVLASSQKDTRGNKVNSRRILAKLYLDGGFLAEAAQAFKGSAVEAGKQPIAGNLYYDAAVNYELLGKNAEAIENYRAYLSHTNNSDKSEAYFRIGMIYKRMNNMKLATDNFRTYCSMSGVNERWVEAAYWIWIHAPTTEKPTWRKRILGSAKPGVGISWAAKVALADAQVEFHDMKLVKIPADPAKQPQVVQKKISLLTELNKHLTNIVKMDSAEEIVAALVMSGMASEHLADAIIRAPIPADFKPEEQKAYRDGLQKVADPFLAKAKESYSSAVERAFDLEVYGTELEMAKSALQRLDPTSVQDRGELAKEESLSGWVANP